MSTRTSSFSEGDLDPVQTQGGGRKGSGDGQGEQGGRKGQLSLQLLETGETSALVWGHGHDLSCELCNELYQQLLCCDLLYSFMYSFVGTKAWLLPIKFEEGGCG